MINKTLLITGASRGIGFSIIEKFASQGWNIAFCSKNEVSLVRTSDYLSKHYPEVKIFSSTVDMGEKEQVLQFGKNCIETFDKIDVLVNNAGSFTPGILSDISFDDKLEELMQVNLYSAYWLGKVIIPHMIQNQLGHIFNISSIAGLKDYDNGGAYTVTKFALTGYTKQLRNELKSKRIRVTGVYPGAVLTDSWAGVDLPDSRFIQPSDIAEMIYHSHFLSESACVEDIVIRPQEGDI